MRAAVDPCCAQTPWLGPSTAAAMLLGALLAVPLPALPGRSWLLALCVLALLLLPWSRLRLAAFALLGFVAFCLHASFALDARLPAALEGEELQLAGWVDGLPQLESRRQRFDFHVERGTGPASVLEGKRIRLSWYETGEPVHAGSRWRFTVRLQRPHGGRNPGGFDFERYALQRGLAATGYVRSTIDDAPSPGSGMAALRERLSGELELSMGSASSRFLRGIGLADTRGLDDADWEALRASGTSHLLAISGLHLGLLASLAAGCALLLYRLIPRLGLYLPLPQGAALLALLAASGYAALAGFGLPTRRALVMVAVALLAVLLRRRSGFMQSLSLALIASLLFDPLAILGAGFWLSFAGVGWLLWALPRQVARTARTWAMQSLHAQLVLSLGLLPLTLWFFGQASLLALPLNLLAIPWMAFTVLPATLIGILLLLLGLPAEWPLRFAGWSMDGLWWLLESSASLSLTQIRLSPPGILALLLAMLAAFWLLLPRAVPGKLLAPLLLVPLFWPGVASTPSGAMDVTVLDVGQGLSVLLRTEHHALLYDAGPALPGALDWGESVVVPALRALGVDQLDAIIISHADNDHAGGASAVLRAFAPQRLLAGEPGQLVGSQPCVGGDRWDWDDVTFRLLHPPAHFPELGNQSSCVLMVEAAGQRLLLPGDIDALIEDRLRRANVDDLHADVLVVPHHGSSGSSSSAFIDVVRPSVALVSAGYRNRFGHPRADVVARYRESGAELQRTADSGAIHLLLDGTSVIAVGERQRMPRFWSESSE